MQNIFRSIRDSLQQLPTNQVDLASAWRFVLSVPVSDVEKIAFILKSNEADLLDTFVDTHVMWQSPAYSVKDLEAGAALKLGPEQYRLSHTIYQLQAGIDGDLATALRTSLEDATNNTLRFTRERPEENEYLARVYTIVLWNYVADLPSEVEDYFWGNYCLLSGLRLGLDLRAMLTGYLNANYRQERVRTDIVRGIYTTMEKNPVTLLQEDGTQSKSIADWLKLAGRALTVHPTEAEVKKFLQNHPLGQKLSESDLAALSSLLVIYSEMKTGAWNKHPDVQEDFPEQVFQYLYKEPVGSDGQGFATLIHEAEAWYRKQEHGLGARKSLIGALIDRIKIGEHLAALTTLNSWLQSWDNTHPEWDLFYYDESDKNFHWNESLFTI